MSNTPTFKDEIAKITKRIDKIDNYASPEAVDLRSKRSILIHAAETLANGGHLSAGLQSEVNYALTAIA